jgi:hypothetical protein
MLTRAVTRINEQRTLRRFDIGHIRAASLQAFFASSKPLRGFRVFNEETHQGKPGASLHFKGGL